MQELANIFEAYLSKSTRIFSNKEALTSKFTPGKILHREEEITALAQILSPSLKMEKPSNVFIYGKSGTGKTLVTTFVCNQLENFSKKKGKGVKVLYTNCKMRKVADTEYRLIASLCRKLGRNLPATGLPTYEIYKNFFELLDREERIYILILDEIDRLVKKCGDEVLYNLVRVNSELKKAKVSIIGISNDITFKTRLDSRVLSSLGEEEIIFPPYDAIQLTEILSERAKIAFREGVLEEGVIQKCAAYAAREHGDARRALELLRIAGEIAEREGSLKVLERHVDLANEKMEREAVIEVVKKQPLQSKILLFSLIKSNRKKQKVYSGDLYDEYVNFCKIIGIKPLTQRRVSDLLNEFDVLGLINNKVISLGRYGRTREINLSIPQNLVEEVEKILKVGLGI